MSDTKTPVVPTADELDQIPTPAGVDRRTFLMRSALLGATSVLTGKAISAEEATKRATAPAPKVPPLSPELEVVKQSKGPVMTVLAEFYKVGPGPSSSHTIGPMR